MCGQQAELVHRGLAVLVPPAPDGRLHLDPAAPQSRNPSQRTQQLCRDSRVTGKQKEKNKPSNQPTNNNKTTNKQKIKLKGKKKYIQRSGKLRRPRGEGTGHPAILKQYSRGAIAENLHYCYSYVQITGGAHQPEVAAPCAAHGGRGATPRLWVCWAQVPGAHHGAFGSRAGAATPFFGEGDSIWFVPPLQTQNF